MPSPIGNDIAPNRTMTISEASAATGLPGRRIIRLIDEEVLPVSVCQMRGRKKTLPAYSMPMTIFGASDAEALGKRTRLAIMRLVGKFAKKNWQRLLDDPRQADNLSFETGSIVVSFGDYVREAMVGLNRLMDAQNRVVEDPDIRGGIPTIRGTRIGVYEIAGLRLNEDVDTILAHYPRLRRKDVEAAELYAKAYPIRRRKPDSGQERVKAFPGYRWVSETIVNLPRQA